MSSTQKRRNAYDYREAYLKHNKGIFGKVYICALCFKPVMKEDMEVDHIIPLSKFGINHVLNCTSTCRKCNRSKSDKVDSRIAREIVYKVIEESILLLNKSFLRMLQTSAQPIRRAKTVSTKLMIAILYILLIKAIINL